MHYPSLFPDILGNGLYMTTQSDHSINYQIGQDHSHISSVNGLSHPQFSISPKFLTQGEMIDSEGNGKIVIIDASPGGRAKSLRSISPTPYTHMISRTPYTHNSRQITANVKRNHCQSDARNNRPSIQATL